MPKFYTTTEMCEIFGVTPITLRRWEARKLDFPRRCKPGNGGQHARCRWLRDEVNAYLAKLLGDRHSVPVLDPDRFGPDEVE
jgi:hypothetical protein